MVCLIRKEAMVCLIRKGAWKATHTRRRGLSGGPEVVTRVEPIGEAGSPQQCVRLLSALG